MKIQDIAYRTIPELSKRLNELYSRLIFPPSKSSVVANDYVVIRDSATDETIKKVKMSNVASYVESTTSIASENQLLKEWTQGKDYEPQVITRDGEGRVTSMTVKWPDASTGTYTATNYNGTHEVYDGYTITHVDASKTVTQSAVTRDGDGAITNKPALTVA